MDPIPNQPIYASGKPSKSGKLISLIVIVVVALTGLCFAAISYLNNGQKDLLSSDAQEKQLVATSTISEKTEAQLNCIKEFDKEVDRKVGGPKNVQLISDLRIEPLYSCVTVESNRPYNFDIYWTRGVMVSGVLNLFTPTYAFFESKGDRVLDYQIIYPGFTMYNYALDSVAYTVFSNLKEGKYKVGDLIPDIDNNESDGASPDGQAALASIDKTTYKGVDIYTIKGASRYKAFLMNKTYILIKYDSDSRDAISEEAATKIAEGVASSLPYVPAKFVLLKSATSSQDFRTIAHEFLRASLDAASDYFAKYKNYKGVCADATFDDATSMLLEQIKIENFGMQCAGGETTLSLGAYVSDGKAGAPDKRVTIDQDGYYSESNAVFFGPGTGNTMPPSKTAILVPGSNPQKYIDIKPRVDSSVTQSEIAMIKSEIKDGTVSSREDCAARVLGLYNSGDSSNWTYAASVTNACVYYLEGGK